MNRRSFIKSTLAIGAALGLTGFPAIIPSRVLGSDSPSNRITMGFIGVGRMGLGDLRSLLELSEVQIVAVCDVDRNRAENARRIVNEYYQQKNHEPDYNGCASYLDYRELLNRPDIDAVSICTPDHWHALQGVAAARAGKDIFIQKPLAYSLHEGRVLSNTVREYDRVLQVGSQQRSDSRFRKACELVRNGRIGNLKHVKVGFGKDQTCDPQAAMAIPENLNYNMWLGPAPLKPYTEKRVHPNEGFGRPGWLRTSDYCLGMITGWGSHHMDIAQWAMGLEKSGPVSINGKARYPQTGLWDVHQEFEIEYAYANGVTLSCCDTSKNTQGVRFEGSEGWIHVKRGFIDSFPKSLLKETIGPGEILLYHSNHHKQNFIDCIKSRKETVAPVEIGHRSASACILGHISMTMNQELKWDPQSEQFIGNEPANRLLSRPLRSPWKL